jgi:hypothetical protein
MEIQIFHHAKIEFSKKFSKRNQNPSRYHNSTTNLKFQHKPKKIIIFQKSSYKNRPGYLLPKGQNPLKLIYSIMKLKNNILALVVGKANRL